MAGIELAIVLSVFAAYKLVRYLVRDDAAAAFTNARDVVELERSIGLWTEPALQSLALQWGPVIEWLNWFYARVHLVSTAAALLILFFVDRATYLWLRRRLVGVTLLGLVIHIAYPLAPPRLMASTGMIDTLQAFGPAIYSAESTLGRLANPYAAMPSLHFAFAVLIAWAVARCCRHRACLVLAIHPIFMLIAIIVTANHYWLDALVGALVIAIVDLGIALRDERRSTRGMLLGN